MENKSTTNIAKIIICLVIASILMETVTSAPLLSNGKELTTKSRNTRRKDGRKLTTKNLKHRNYKLFAEAAKEWNNSCSSIAWEGGSGFEQNYNSSYQSFKLSVHQLKTSLASMSMKVINSSAVKGWERFHNESYKFLPTKPTGIARKWHKDVQIYYASIWLLHKYQIESDAMHDNDTISQELKEILDRARELLCDIELFVNATSNKNGSHKPYWYDARSMSEIVTLENDENNPRLKIHGIFLKARFQEYVNKLYKRIRTFKLDRNLKSGKFRRTSTIQPHKNHRRNRPGRRRKTTVRYNGESAVTEKTYIITTRNPRRGSKTSRRTRTPGQKRQRQNKINQNLQ